ncbi:striatin-interacting protein 1 homolog [Drosophila miranda]|uniref:striatin-interacting protein 1 homolog n=1 Tax=Drosophila miranda TaxID=7229 RepID=UPI00143F9FB8|nr:striatin-interacting protein 1 homolog [Drosophila miranda]XP_033243117.1 striatin-interacting protein 1 homolog [Drosophila miranda]
MPRGHPFLNVGGRSSNQQMNHSKAGNGSADMLSFVALLKRFQQGRPSIPLDTHDVDANCDGPDLDFVYSDVDSYQNEIAELYSYTEYCEFQSNVKAFEDQMELYDLPPNWQKQDSPSQRSIVMKLIDQLEVSNRTLRMQAARCILYLAQGCWAEVQSDEEQHQNTRDNVIVLYDLGVFSSFIDLLNMEIESACSPDIVAVKITNVTLVDSTDIRVILSVLYIITETIRDEREKASEDYKDLAESFVQEINSPLADGELLAVKLLGMITRFCSGAAPQFPMKKVVLLLWKVSLLGLGGMDVLKKLKNEYRLKVGLDPIKEDTLEVTKCMRASSPPATATDILENQYPKRNFKRSLMKQRFLDEPEQIDMEMSGNEGSGNANNASGNNGGSNGEEELLQYYRPFDDPSSSASNTATANPNNQPSLTAPLAAAPPVQITARLPWTPKVRQKDIDQFLDISRNKFIGYSLIGDHESLAGLPQPIHEGFKTLQRHMYMSLADMQIKKEEDIARNPISTHEDEIKLTPAEILYQAILPNLPQYMIALLKVLLAASPTSKSKTESINIMADVLPKKMPLTATQSTKLTVDMGRHKEIIVKAVSAIILLYLKHFKINHVYQFEFMSQHLVFANCIPLVLKFFNQTITEYVNTKNNIPLLDFPSCVIGEQPDLSGDSFVYGADMSDKPYSWRNVFSCINLLRILNKLIKWKHSRVMMLVVFKSAPILKKTLKVRHAMMQLYVLKLLKMQTKYLGRQWRKSNMKTMSAIYSKVRHRLNDDWAFGNDLESRPWDFQAEECTLRACVDRFNLRRYPEATQKCGAGGGSGNNGGGGTAAQNAENSQQSNMNAGNGYGGNNGGADSNGYGGNNGGGGNNSGNNQQQQLNDYGVEGGFPSDEILTHSDFAFFGHSGWWDRKVELTDYFKANYAVWLEEEVYNSQIDWDAL